MTSVIFASFRDHVSFSGVIPFGNHQLFSLHVKPGGGV